MLSGRARKLAVFVLLLVAVVLGAFAVDELRHAGTPEETNVTFLTENESERGTLDARVAASFRERYTGLSNTESLGNDEGMLFVHDSEGNHTIVMRDMSFPIDVIFVDKNRTITSIYHAETDAPSMTGRSKWTVEAPYNWTVRHNVSTGDRVRIEWLDEE
ncbi:MAG: DUF192 domain-containing protein [Halobacteriales archaeon]